MNKQPQSTTLQTSRPVPNRLTAVCIIFVTLLITACAGDPSVKEGVSQSNLDAMSGPASKVVVMALYPDQNLDVRVVIENAVVDGFRQSGAEASAGFRVFETYSGLEARVAEVKKVMRAGGFDALVLVDPFRVVDHDPGEWAQRRSVYQAFDLRYSSTFNAIGQMAEEAESAKSEFDVTVWDLGSESFVWYKEYDLNAPGGYDLNVAKEYAVEFGKMVSSTLRSEGVVQ